MRHSHSHSHKQASHGVERICVEAIPVSPSSSRDLLLASSGRFLPFPSLHRPSEWVATGDRSLFRDSNVGGRIEWAVDARTYRWHHARRQAAFRHSSSGVERAAGSNANWPRNAARWNTTQAAGWVEKLSGSLGGSLSIGSCATKPSGERDRCGEHGIGNWHHTPAEHSSQLLK